MIMEALLQSIPTDYQDFPIDKIRIIVHMATTMADSPPQVTPVWFNIDCTHILIITAEGRINDRNMCFHPCVALCITYPRDAYRYLQIRGKVVETTTEGGNEHINPLSMKYSAQRWQTQPGQQRVFFKIYTGEHLYT